MATTMHKILQKPLQQGIFPYLKLQNPLNLLPSLLHHQPNLDALPEYHNVYNFKTGEESNRISTSLLQEKPTMDNGFHVFPSFSLGFFLDPKLSSGLHQMEAVKAEKSDVDESQIICANVFVATLELKGFSFKTFRNLTLLLLLYVL
ncbi:hypothetical protein Pfo_024285 [Paulownia fortunei]|nr:hypothetical protein Pfo_024285 [Paulownia fortunei]